MTLSPKLLEILVCPENKTPVRPAAPELVEELNQRIASQKLVNRAGLQVTERFEEGLIRADGKYLYPVRNGIPVMLIDEGIPLPTGAA